MKKAIIAAGSVALLAGAAEAAPAFGSRGLEASSAKSAAKSELRENPLRELISFLSLRAAAKSTAPVSKAPRSEDAEECPVEKDKADKKSAEMKPALQAGPEPVYLAF